MRWAIAAAWLAVLCTRADALEIWLARDAQCTSCLIYQRAAQQRGYGAVLRHAGQDLPILWVDKPVLADDVLAQLPADVGPESPHWSETLTVLVMDVGRVVFAADIQESADNNELRLPDAVMFPPDEPADDDASLRGADPYTPFFVRSWNLEYFVDVALGRRPRRDAAGPIDLASPTPAALGPRNVILWGSAATPLENSLFVPRRIAEIRAALEGAGVPGVRFLTLFGHGPGVDGNDTSVLVDGRVRFTRADVEADLAADAAGLSSALSGVRERAGARTLLVQVGHSGPAGSPLWGHGLTLLPEDLERVGREPGVSLVMVSGACHSGRFATAVQCGFFAAHPDVTAAGCQLSPEALERSDDYLRHFFRALSSQPARGRRARPPTLHDAHWRAVTALEDHQLPYTTTDALIDEHFAAHPESLPESLTVAEILAGARALSGAEAEAAAALTDGLGPGTAIPLGGHVEANHAAEERLADAFELPSAERNRLLGLPYKLSLTTLARRVAYARLSHDDAAFARAASCERQSLPELLGGAR